MKTNLSFACFSLLIVFVIVEYSRAQNWIFVTSTGNGQIGSYVDVDSIEGTSEMKKFNMYHYFKGTKTVDSRPIERLFAKSYVNCNTRTIGYLEVEYEWSVGLDKEKVIIPARSEVSTSKPVRPNSVDEAILDFACNYQKQ
ncbi:MAG: surface-adhesin E family protein [Thermodesulfobacteriota bacterium]